MDIIMAKDGSLEYKLASINVYHYLKECANSEKVYWNYEAYRNAYKVYQRSIFTYYKFNEEFADTLTFWGNGNNYLTNIRFNYDELLNKLQVLLNIYSDKVDGSFNVLFKNRINILDSIKTIDELQKEFPEIYLDYVKGNDLYREFSGVMDFADFTDKTGIMKDANNKKSYYYACGLRFSVPHFVHEQAKLYRNFINNLGVLYKYIIDYTLDGCNYVDENKKKLFLMNAYLDAALECKSHNKQRIYFTVINDYFNSNTDKNVIIHDESGNVISYIDVLRKFRKFVSMNSSLDQLLLDWVLLPNGFEQDDDKDTIKLADVGIVKVNPNLEKYVRENDRKLFFYEGNVGNRLRCVGKAKGLSFNKGYTAYIYENGEILLDKIVSLRNISSSYGNAIYNLNINNFELLSKIDKMTLRKNKLCPVIIHDSTWENKAQQIIDKPATEETIKEARRLVKRMRDSKSK